MAAETRRINVSSGRPLEAKAHYSRALRLDDVVLQSGTTAIDREGNVAGEGDIGIQVDAIMDLARESMGTAEGHFEDVVRARLYVADPALLDAAGLAFARHFGEVRPVLTLVPISKLARPTQLIEIELEAVDGARDDAVRFCLPGSGVSRHGGSDAVRIGDRVLVGGLRAGAAGAAEEEVDTLLSSIRELIERAGAAWEDLVYTKSFLPSMAELGPFIKGFAARLGSLRPVGNLLGTPFIEDAKGRFVIEAEAVAGAGNQRRDHGEAPVGPFAESVRVGDRIYLSTQNPVEDSGSVFAEGDWAAQFDYCMERLERALEKTGATLADVITRRIYTHTDADMNRPYGTGPAWFEATRPVALGCRVPEHVHPGFSVCLEALAVRGAGTSIEWRSIAG